MVQMKLGNSYFPVSITILENSSLDMLFGLDTLRRYRCSIDLANNCLRMSDGSSGIEEVPFLGEGEIPQKEEDIESGQGFLGGGGTKEGGGNKEGETDAMNVDNTGASSGTLPPPPQNNSEQGLKSLVEMGFSESEARQALNACGGNVQEAAALLFASK